MGWSHVWLPKFIACREVPSEKAVRVLSAIRPVAGWLDQHQFNNFDFISKPPFSAVPQMLCALCGILMPILEIVPFSSSILGAAIVVIIYGMLTRNGLLIVLTCIALLASGIALINFLTG